MIRASIIVIFALIIQNATSPFSSARPSDNSFSGLVVTSAFTTTPLYTTLTTAISSLTGLSATVDVTTSPSVYAILSPVVLALANSNIGTFQALNNNLNTWNTFFAQTRNANANYINRYNQWSAALNNLTQSIPLVAQYNQTLPNLTIVTGFVKNMSDTDFSIFNVYNQFLNKYFEFNQTTNFVLSQLTSLNSQLSIQLAADESFYNNQLMLNFNLLSQPVGQMINQVVQPINQLAVYMANYQAGVPLYLNNMVGVGLNNIQNSNTQIQNIITQINTFLGVYQSNMTTLTSTLVGNINTQVTNNVNAFNTYMSTAPNQYNILWGSVNTVNGILTGMVSRLPFMTLELQWAGALLNWAMTKVSYDFTNLLNTQMMYTTSINNILQSFDSLVVAGNHFNDNLLPGPVGSFQVYSGLYTYGVWNLDVAANFPGGLNPAQTSRCQVYSWPLIVWNAVVTANNITRITVQNLDINYAFEAYLGYVSNSTGIYAYVAVSDPVAASGLLQVNVQCGTPSTSLSVSPNSVSSWGSASLLSNFGAFFSANPMGPTGAAYFGEEAMTVFQAFDDSGLESNQSINNNLQAEPSPATLEEIDLEDEEAVA